MQSIVSRRKILIASLGAAAVGLTRTAQAAPANVPSIWDGKKMYDSFLKDGTGFSFPHKPNAPVAVVAFDTQCPDCMRLFTRIKPLLNDVDVIFYPISFMNIHSEPQGTTILMSRIRQRLLKNSMNTSKIRTSAASVTTSLSFLKI